MEKTEFILSGTIDEIVSVLENEFEYDEKQARFIAYVESMEKTERLLFEEEELNIWYLQEQVPQQLSIGRTPYTISITGIKKEMYDIFFKIIGRSLYKGEIDWENLGIGFLWALVNNFQKIDTDHYCIYLQLTMFCQKSQNDMFEIEQIIPWDYKNGEQVCNCQPDEWQCPYLNSDTCSLSIEFIEKLLGDLTSSPVVLKKVGNMWKRII